MLIGLTETISIQAAPDVVREFVGDPGNLPLWAPAVARAEVQIDVRVSPDLGTVDFFAALPGGGVASAFSRVVPNGDGSEFLFTRFLGEHAGPADLAAARAVVCEELEAVRRCCDAALVRD